MDLPSTGALSGPMTVATGINAALTTFKGIQDLEKGEQEMAITAEKARIEKEKYMDEMTPLRISEIQKKAGEFGPVLTQMLDASGNIKNADSDPIVLKKDFKETMANIGKNPLLKAVALEHSKGVLETQLEPLKNVYKELEVQHKNMEADFQRRLDILKAEQVKNKWEVMDQGKLKKLQEEKNVYYGTDPNYRKLQGVFAQLKVIDEKIRKKDQILAVEDENYKKGLETMADKIGYDNAKMVMFGLATYEDRLAEVTRIKEEERAGAEWRERGKLRQMMKGEQGIEKVKEQNKKPVAGKTHKVDKVFLDENKKIVNKWTNGVYTDAEGNVLDNVETKNLTPVGPVKSLLGAPPNLTKGPTAAPWDWEAHLKKAREDRLKKQKGL